MADSVGDEIAQGGEMAAEIESLYVTFHANVDQLRNATRDAVANVEQAAASIRNHAQVSEQGQVQATRLAASQHRVATAARESAHSVNIASIAFATTMNTLITASQALFTHLTGMLRHALAAFAESERAILSLNAAMRAAGTANRETMEKYKDFAASLERTGVVTGEEVIRLLALAESFGKTGEAARSAVSNAIALSVATGRSADQMLRFTQALEEGAEEALAFGRTIPQLRAVKDVGEAAEVTRRLIATGFGMMSESAETASGKMTIVKNKFDELTKAIGGAVSEALLPLLDLVNVVVSALAELPKPVLGVVGAMLTFTTVVSGLSVVTSAAVTIWHSAVSAISKFTNALGMANASAIVLRGTLAVGLVTAVYVAIKALHDMNRDVQQLQATVEGTRDAIARQGQEYSESTRRMIERINTTDDLAERERKLQQQIAITERMIAGNRQAVEDSEEALREKVGMLDRLRNAIGMTAPEYLELKHTLDLNRAVLAQNEERLRALRRELEEVAKVKQRGRKEVEEFTAELRKSIETLGMTADEKKIFELERKPGVTKEMLDEARALIQMRNEAEALAKAKEELNRSIEATISRLEEETMRLTMSSDEFELWRLQSQGASKEKLEEIAAMQQFRQALEERNQMEQEAAAIIDRVKTAEERRAEAIARLTQLRQAGLLTQEQFNRAVAQEDERLREAAKSAAETKKNLEQLQAVQAGSMEALARVEEHFERIRGGGVGRLQVARAQVGDVGGVGVGGAALEMRAEPAQVVVAERIERVVEPQRGGREEERGHQIARIIELLNLANNKLERIANRELIRVQEVNL